MLVGAHALLFSKDAEADRAFFADVLGLPSVDAGADWLIFELPPAELAVHPGEEARHDLYLMCDDLHATVAELEAKGARFEGGVADQRWGLVTAIRLPGGGTLGLYEPRHPSPLHKGNRPRG
jgi:catechol 2,3-dioxygenase-like lactoylglutathione lyase family enzyme